MSEPIRVLLVDDEELFVANLTRILVKRGMSVQAASDGAAAIETLAAGAEFDVIVLDLRMPGMNGVDTIKAIRERSPLLPVILLTGHADIKQVSEALREGVNEVLLKPCPLDTLVATIENVHEWKVVTENLP